MPKYLTFIELAGLALLAFLVFCYIGIAGSFSRHMIMHIVLMSAIAPVTVSRFLKSRYFSVTSASAPLLVAALAVQAFLLFAWHSPPGVGWMMKSHVSTWLVQVTLFASALWFWFAVLNQSSQHLWRSVIALILTGKLFCLTAVLLMFAPRVLYNATIEGSAMPIVLEDQQLAGLLMVTVCPISYVLAAVALISRWLWDLSEPKNTLVAADPGFWRNR